LQRYTISKKDIVMKKELLYVCSLLLLAVGVAGCSNHDENDYYDDKNVVPEFAATEEVKTFFEEDFSTNYSDINQKSGFFTDEDYMYLNKGVIVRPINSREEFEQAYTGKYQLPDIDFTRNTLIVGLTNSLNSGETLGDVRLLNTGGDYNLQVFVNKNVNPERLYSLAITPLFFWKIYPKLPISNLTATRIVKEVSY